MAQKSFLTRTTANSDRETENLITPTSYAKRMIKSKYELKSKEDCDSSENAKPLKALFSNLEKVRKLIKVNAIDHFSCQIFTGHGMLKFYRDKFKLQAGNLCN